VKCKAKEKEILSYLLARSYYSHHVAGLTPVCRYCRCSPTLIKSHIYHEQLLVCTPAVVKSVFAVNTLDRQRRQRHSVKRDHAGFVVHPSP